MQHHRASVWWESRKGLCSLLRWSWHQVSATLHCGLEWWSLTNVLLCGQLVSRLPMGKHLKSCLGAFASFAILCSSGKGHMCGPAPWHPAETLAPRYGGRAVPWPCAPQRGLPSFTFALPLVKRGKYTGLLPQTVLDRPLRSIKGWEPLLIWAVASVLLVTCYGLPNSNLLYKKFCVQDWKANFAWKIPQILVIVSPWLVIIIVHFLKLS